jgi:hypothetical protein
MRHQNKYALLACRVALVSVAIYAPTFPALASSARLSAFFVNRSAVISSRFGSLTLTFAGNGTVQGWSTAVFALGEKKANDSGRWWVQGSSVCIRWSIWFEARTRCFAVHPQDRSAFKWRSEEGEEGAGRLLDQGVDR